MAYGQEGGKRAYTADADFSETGQYRAVKRTTTGFALCGANDAGFLGILQDDPKLGEVGTIWTRESSKVVAGAAFAAGNPLTTDATGRLVVATAGQRILMRALEPAAAAGDLSTAEIGPYGVV